MTQISIEKQGWVYCLEALLRDGTQYYPMYLGLIDADGFVRISSLDTASSHAGWTECQNYSASTRPAWNVSAATDGLMPVLGTTFTFSALKTVTGMFIITNNTKGGTSGLLVQACQFTVPIVRQPGQTLTIAPTYSLDVSPFGSYTYLTKAGAKQSLDTWFHNGTQVAQWYMGLIAGGASVETSADDTMSSHSGWTEFQDYSGGTRPAVTFDATNQTLLRTTAQSVIFRITAPGTIRGYFLTSDSTIGGTSGILLDRPLLRASNLAVNAGNKITAAPIFQAIG